MCFIQGKVLSLVMLLLVLFNSYLNITFSDGNNNHININFKIADFNANNLNNKFTAEFCKKNPSFILPLFNGLTWVKHLLGLQRNCSGTFSSTGG